MPVDPGALCPGVRPVFVPVFLRSRPAAATPALVPCMVAELVVSLGDQSGPSTAGGNLAEINLTQAEADALIAMEKHRADDERRDYPALGGSLIIPLVSADKREQFVLDVWRGGIDLAKGTYQNRARQVVILVRLDFGGRPHENPDGQVVPTPHLHIYREGYSDKWAVALPADRFSAPSDSWKTLGDFMHYCNVTKPPLIEKGLFV